LALILDTNALAALAVPVIVLGEYLFGIRQSRFRARYELCELTLAGRPIPTNDVWIAALARQHQLAIVSRDRHFHGIKGLRAVAWQDIGDGVLAANERE
jgi:predicted nucleic acid-binding protein